MLKLLFVGVMLSFMSGCKQSSDADSSLAFNPDEANVYQLTVNTISSMTSGYATSGDTLLLRMDLQLVQKDSSVNRMLMLIRDLKFSVMPFKQVDINRATRGVSVPMK